MSRAAAGGIAGILERCVAGGDGRRAYTNLVEGRDEGRVLTYAELYRLAGQGAGLLRASVRPGERVLLLHDDTLEFMVCFLACIFARVVAVPIPPPDLTRLKRTLPRVQAVVADCGAGAVLASARIRDHLQQAFAGVGDLKHLPWFVGEDFAAAAASEPLPVAPGDLAYLQYSSGSTASPKGIMMTHGNLLDNLRMLQRGFAYDRQSTTVTWMPYFHDYGLVDGLLQPLFSQIPCYVMSPVAFIKRPWRWLEAVSRFRATHTHGPNFAYQMCLDRVADEKLAGLDLSSLCTAGCGAEPVRRDTVERFVARFAPCGFRPDAFVPAYGLAEATLVVTTKLSGTPYRSAFLAPEEQQGQRCIDAATDDPRARAVVSCGVTPDDYALAIVDPKTGAELPEDTVGEIWIANPSVAAGYWNRPGETREAFRAYTAAGRGPMLRTGDLGFLRGGELFVTGRIKDLIIVNGTNHYPQDVEQTVEALGAWVRPTFTAAFAIEQNGEERLAVAAELNGRLDDPERQGAQMIADIRGALTLQHEVSCAAVVLLPRGSLPKTSSGKIQRSACRAAFLRGEWEAICAWREASPAERAPAQDDAAHAVWQDLVRQVVAQRKGIPAGAVGALEPFANLGISSREAVEIAAALEERTGRPVPETILWEYPNPRALADFLAGTAPLPGPAAIALPGPAAIAPHGAGDEGIAVIGMGCRFPGGSDSPEAFWRFLNGGRPAISEPPPGRFGDRQLAFRAGFVTGLFDFDAAFFGISDLEAESMDPQQRLLLATAWHALEDAGVVPERLAGSDTGVFVGFSASDYSQQVYGVPGEQSRYGATGTSAALIANRLSYFLDLRGPSMAVDTACSASLVAVHQACAALRSGDCSLALAGGVNALLSAAAVETLQNAEMLSPSGKCRPFDAAADGYVRGEGCGVVVLKTLARARQDGDAVLAVIRGSAVAQDGRSNGLTAPNGAAQRQTIGKALARAGVAAAEVGYVEAHGTGTPLGDPIELRALADCYGQEGEAPCRVGAVKAHIGHLEGAAGIAGVIKTLLAMRHGAIPGSPFPLAPNPRSDVSGTRLAVVTEAVAWPAGEGRRIAAVSSFGFGGTLAHAILEAEPAAEPQPRAADGAQLLLLSARDPAALARLAERYALLPGLADGSAAAAVCAGAALKRTAFPCRAAFAAATGAGLVARLRAFAPTDGRIVRPGLASAPIAFVFAGQGAQREGTGRELYRRFPEFRAAVDEVDAVLRQELGMAAEELLFRLPAGKLAETRYAQPALVLLQLGLIRLWEHWGVRPALVLGHGVGEFAAAVAAGVFPAQDAVRLVVARARPGFAEALEGVALHEPRLPVLSTVTGALAGADMATSDYWLRLIDEPVNFAAAAALLPDWQTGVAIEIGPAAALCGPGAACPRDAGPLWLPSLGGAAEDESLLDALGRLFVLGVPVRWERLYEMPPGERVDLPLYPFGGREYRVAQPAPGPALPHTYVSRWVAAEPGKPARPERRPCIFVGDAGTGQSLAEALAAAPQLHLVETLPWERLAGLDVGRDNPLVVVHCRAREGEDTPQAASRLAQYLLAGLASLGRRHCRCRVWAVTHGLAPQAEDEIMSPEAACVWGAGRVAALEMPETWGGLIDLPWRLGASDAASLAHVMAAGGDEDQWALRGGRCFVPRLAETVLPEGARQPSLRPDAAYWVVGGAGALGRHALRALRESGAGQLVVSGRQANPPPELAALGVRYFQADVADAADVRRVLGEIDALGYPLAGIVHAAGTASEYPIEQLTPERFRQVADSKVQGAWNLHAETLGRPLQFFVCFASIAGLWGSANQAHYAAANHFLDALCEHRRRAGLRALSIDWGPWSGGGLVSAEVEARLVHAGLDLLPPQAALALFTAALASGLPRIAAVDVRWPEFAAGFTARRASPFLSNVMPAPSEPKTASQAPAPLTGTPRQVRAEIERRVSIVVAEKLGTGRTPEPGRGFFELGLDSLAVVAIHKRLVAELGISFPRPDMFNYSNIDALTERLLQLWLQENAIEEAAPEVAVEQLSGAEIAAHIEAEMAALGLNG